MNILNQKNKLHVLVTGSNGFIGKNLVIRLREQSDFIILQYVRNDSLDRLNELVEQSDLVVHLAGENRPEDISAFEAVNTTFTEQLCDVIKKQNKEIPVIFTSSVQAELDNMYGHSKLMAEQAVKQLSNDAGSPVVIYRLSGVFGKWCKPNYNSVVATFCHNVANDLPIEIHNPDASIKLVYVDDLVSDFIKTMQYMPDGINAGEVVPQYTVTVGELARLIERFKKSRIDLHVDRVGAGLIRALYSTYVSYLLPDQFVYDVPSYGDERGLFLEILKTEDSGQVSFFTAHPGITRGGHYHHSKTEKFLVVKGTARFGFRNVLIDECYEIITSGENLQIVDTVPGWAHDITNIGDDDMIVLLWANEVFDRDCPDTITYKV